MTRSSTPARQPLQLNVAQCVQHLVDTFGRDLHIAMPLGLGKPVPLMNALYQRVKADPALHLTLITALSLEKPVWHNELERRFLQPFVERVWAGVPDLDFMLDLRKGELAKNVKLHEIFFKAGAYHTEEEVQQNYINSNYTHVVRDANDNGNNVFAHIVAKKVDADGKVRYSASCNADTSLLTLKNFAEAIERGEKRMRIAMVNPHLPFMYGDAEVDASMYDVIIDTEEGNFTLFNTPRLPVADADYMIGLNTSALVKDGGTLQIGIGALGDAVAYGLKLRHEHNDVYRQLLESTGLRAKSGHLISKLGGDGRFDQGLYGSTEMLVDGFLQLYKAGIVKRRVYHHAAIQALVNQGAFKEDRVPADVLDRMVEQELLPPYLTEKDFTRLQHHGVFRDDVRYEAGADGSAWLLRGTQRFSPVIDTAEARRALTPCLGDALRRGVVLTGGFFIGPRDFYKTLNEMPDDERHQFEMTGVEVANQLYGDETLRSLQRKDGRFCNTAMKATLLGHMVSDATEDGWVVSGVGGQYNFVAMAHALPDGRLVMMVKSTRHEGAKVLSNILYNYGHVTIPRHLRDFIVTEYGIADLRGKCDADIIKAMLNVADSRFQEQLLAEAKQHRKIEADYEIPAEYRNNTPARLAETLRSFRGDGYFPPFPFGSEFDRAEMALAAALKALKAASVSHTPEELGQMMLALPAEVPAPLKPLLQRMGLASPASKEEVVLQRTTMLALRLAHML
jgi:acyl-CoA hydrolase